MSTTEILFKKFGRLGVCLDCEVKDRRIQRLTREIHHWIGQCGKLSKENAILSNKAWESKQVLRKVYGSLKGFV